MDLKQLKRKIESLKSEIRIAGDSVDIAELEGIKETVKAIDFDMKIDIMLTKDKIRYEYWKEIKKLILRTTKRGKK